MLKMLKNIRVILASFFWIALVLLFLDFTGALRHYLGWVAKIQFIPAILAHNIILIAALLLLTLLLGRVYCSVLCPLGICQDMVSGVAGKIKKNRFTYRPPRTVIRCVLVAVYALSLVTGITFISEILEPYSAFGRMVSSLLSPLYMWGNNLLAYFAEAAGSYAFYTVDVWLKSAGALVAAILTFITISIFAWKTGRGYCNLICPVGTILGFASKCSLVKIRLYKENCKGCGLCVKNCKAACIDIDRGKIDHSRCVSCYVCLKKCPKGAIKYSMKKIKPVSSDAKATALPQEGEKIDNNANAETRRGFLSGLLFLLTGLFAGKKLLAYEFDGGLVPLEKKRIPPRSNPIIPAGAGSVRHFRKHCTGCQLCVSVCPNNVLRPSNKLAEFMQPFMSFERGYCRPECVKCSEVCPTGALQPITAEEKSATQIGYAVWNPQLCVVLKDGVNCDLCAVKCPTAAITLIDQKPGNNELPKIPMIDENRCIGCGACEQLCPSRPNSAIYVEGIDTHRKI